MNIFFLSIIFASIIAYEAPGLVKKKLWRELAAFSVLLLIGMAYSYGIVLDLALPNPTKAIEALFSPVSQYLEKIMS